MRGSVADRGECSLRPEGLRLLSQVQVNARGKSSFFRFALMIKNDPVKVSCHGRLSN